MFITFAISSDNFVFIIQQLVSGESDMNLCVSLLQTIEIHVSRICIFICFKPAQVRNGFDQRHRNCAGDGNYFLGALSWEVILIIINAKYLKICVILLKLIKIHFTNLTIYYSTNTFILYGFMIYFIIIWRICVIVYNKIWNITRHNRESSRHRRIQNIAWP